MDRAGGDPHCRLAARESRLRCDRRWLRARALVLAATGGALNIAKLAGMAKADRRLALTDTDNMFGALEFSEKMAGVNIQPIIGCVLCSLRSWTS